MDQRLLVTPIAIALILTAMVFLASLPPGLEQGPEGQGNGETGNGKNNLPVYSGPIPDSGLCERSTTGWQCVLTKELGQANVEGFAELEAEFEGLCGDQRGNWKCYGDCMPSYDHYCDMLFDDAGEKCLSSNDCMGYCVVDRDKVEEIMIETGEGIQCEGKCSGVCAEYPLRECDRWFEVNNNVIEDHTGIICD